MSKEVYEVFEARYKGLTPYDAPHDIIVHPTFTMSVGSFDHTYQVGNLKIVFENVIGVTSDAHPGTTFVYPGHADEIRNVSELALAMKRGRLGGQALEDAIEVTGESIYRAATRARSASVIFRQSR
jgi:hypothetical protein